MATYVTPLDPERAERCERVFGSPLVPVTSSRPELALIRGRVLPVFWVDQDRLTGAQIEAMLDDLCQRFEVPLAEGRAELAGGVPFIADECAVLTDEDLDGRVPGGVD